MRVPVRQQFDNWADQACRVVPWCANPMSKKHTVGFDAHGKIDRSDFGVKAFVPMVSDQQLHPNLNIRPIGRRSAMHQCVADSWSGLMLSNISKWAGPGRDSSPCSWRKRRLASSIISRLSL